jgi:hypothetical protein
LGGVREPLFFCLLNPQVMGLGFFQVKPDFLFSEFSIRYKAKWRPQGDATLFRRVKILMRLPDGNI